MYKKTFVTLTLAILAIAIVVQIPGNETVHSQGRPAVTQEMLDKRRAIESELQSIAIVERKLMIPMRDGKRIASDVYRPKDTSKKYPAIFRDAPINLSCSRGKLQFSRHLQRHWTKSDRKIMYGELFRPVLRVKREPHPYP